MANSAAKMAWSKPPPKPWFTSSRTASFITSRKNQKIMPAETAISIFNRRIELPEITGGKKSPTRRGTKVATTPATKLVGSTNETPRPVMRRRT